MLRKLAPVVFAASLAISALISILAMAGAARAQDVALNTSQDIFDKVKRCFKRPALRPSRPGMQITVHFSFKRNGELLGHPRITYESPEASDDDRLKYRIAIMEAFVSCTPLSFTDGLAHAVAGRPFRLLIDDRRKPKARERQAWLTPTTR